MGGAACAACGPATHPGPAPLEQQTVQGPSPQQCACCRDCTHASACLRSLHTACRPRVQGRDVPALRGHAERCRRPGRRRRGPGGGAVCGPGRLAACFHSAAMPAPCARMLNELGRHTAPRSQAMSMHAAAAQHVRCVTSDLSTPTAPPRLPQRFRPLSLAAGVHHHP